MGWMIYGANGFTGRLIAEEALRRGHRPTLAGRSRDRVEPIARDLGLPFQIASLQDPAALREALAGQELVIHAAGPFIHTGEPMMRACLDAGASYVDITGEIPVFQSLFAHDEEAVARGVALIGGAGFDVVPSDCLARHVADRLPGARRLEIAIAGSMEASHGTTLSAIEMIPRGGLVRRGERLEALPFGTGSKRVRFSDRERLVTPIPWGDLETAWHSTRIPEITTYMALPGGADRLLRVAGPLLQRVLARDSIRTVVGRIAAGAAHGPDAELRRTGRSHFWARASDDAGREAEAWLDTAESYELTALATVRIAERVIAEKPRGALSPAMAFGADFVLEIPGTVRTEL